MSDTENLPDPKNEFESPPPNSLKGVMEALNSEWSFDEWFHWPPDLFALTSLLLKTTGAYRFAVLPPVGRWPEIADWETEVRREASAWWDWIAGMGGLPDIIRGSMEKLRALQISSDIEDIRAFCKNTARPIDPADYRHWEVCRSLLELHAIADEACRGFGLPHAETQPARSAMCYLANMLLLSAGTLSRLPKYKVMVLPKMRTPQVGLTLRSLSHHVTVHQSEVEVVWRTIPWINSDEETINIMVLPWPRNFRQTWVKPEHQSVNRDSSEPARYFTIKRGNEERLCADDVMAMISASSAKVNRLHIIVLPELALDRSELDDLKSALSSEMARDRMPMIITGLRDEAHSDQLGHNKVVLSVFFGGKWYDLEQDKHHRWKLDADQIKQYNLGGVLSSARDWWEAIDIPDRRLTFLCPNGWLTLCPLICEDLGRLEPVSELIRGVGPTLLIAILLDGPQLRQRWPGRYASVLADDPGTAVLTVSSRGMANASSPGRGQEKANGIVALWKDQITGWKEIQLDEDEDAKILTITATWKQEFTADGRGDSGMAAVFSLQGEHSIRVDDFQAKERPKVQTSEPFDLRELAAFTFLADAALGVPPEIVDNLGQWALNRRHSSEDWLMKGFLPGDSIFTAICRANPDSEGTLRKTRFNRFIDVLTEKIKTVEPNGTSYLENLVATAESILQEIDRKSKLPKGKGRPDAFTLRVEIYSALAILWAVHKRLADRRRSRGLTSETEKLLSYIERLLPPKHDSAWYAALDYVDSSG